MEDYSVSQTTLEQIFQGFADLKFNENVPTYCIDEESGELAKIIFEDSDEEEEEEQEVEAEADSGRAVILQNEDKDDI